MTTPETSRHAEAGKGRSLGWVAAPAIIFLALAALFVFALQTGDPSKIPSALIGRETPETTFRALEGLQRNGAPVPGFTNQDLATGKVTVVNFWSSWCLPCTEEHPLLVELKNKAGVELFGVNYKDKPAAANRFLARHGNPFNRVGVDDNGRNAIEWGVYGMPETFVVNGKGVIAYKHVGPITPESLKTKVIPAIEAARSALSTAK